jgi:hypothetical protein
VYEFFRMENELKIEALKDVDEEDGMLWIKLDGRTKLLTLYSTSTSSLASCNCSNLWRSVSMYSSETKWYSSMLISVGVAARGPWLSGSLGCGLEDSGVMPFEAMMLVENERLAIEGTTFEAELSWESLGSGR